MQVLLYYHGGSDNRGCEAIVRSTVDIITKNGFSKQIDLLSARFIKLFQKIC